MHRSADRGPDLSHIPDVGRIEPIRADQELDHLAIELDRGDRDAVAGPLTVAGLPIPTANMSAQGSPTRA